MKEFIEKLIEVLARDTRIGRKSCDFAVEDVMNLAEEYNNGWIPCSERLPEEGKRVLLCTKDKQVCQGKRIIFCEHNRYDLDGLLRYCFDNEIIAWQPLPEPYKEGGEVNE